MIVQLVQLEIAWENKHATIDRVRKLLASKPPKPDSLVVLPEMFATGFSMNVPMVREGAESPSERFMAEVARKYRCTVVGGAVNVEGGKALNQALVVSPSGERLATFNKLHPFGNEAQHYEPGNGTCLFNWQGAKVAPLVCYDLRFPESFREAVKQGAEIFVVIANWPARRIAHWDSLLCARAIENLAHVIGVNRCGVDPYHAYPGHSQVVSHYGQVIAHAREPEGVLEADIDITAQRAWRAEFPALRDMR